jgi:N-acetylglutamate synthase-like GNAT family acetyltransferase
VAIRGNYEDHVRTARSADLPRISAIDAESAAVEGALLERATPGELEDAVHVGDLLVADSEQGVVGYIHVDRRSRIAVYVAGLAVVPRMRGRGYGTALLASGLKAVEQNELPVYTMTSPRNSAMLRLLFDQGFVGPWGLPHFFGPGLHRIGMRLDERSAVPPAVTSWCRADHFESWATVLSTGYAVVETTVRGRLPLLGLSRFPVSDGSACVRRFKPYQRNPARTAQRRSGRHATLESNL